MDKRSTAFLPAPGQGWRCVWVAAEPAFHVPLAIVSVVQTSGTVADKTEHPVTRQLVVI